MASIPKSTRSSHYVIWGSAIILIILAVYAVRTLTRERVSVKVANVSYQDLVKSFSTNGKVEPLDDFEAHAQAAGQVQEINVDVARKRSKPASFSSRWTTRSPCPTSPTPNPPFRPPSSPSATSNTAARRTSATPPPPTSLEPNSSANRMRPTSPPARNSWPRGAQSPAEVAAAQHRIQVDDNYIQSIQQHSTQRYGEADKARAEAELADAQAAVTAAQRAYDTADIHSPIRHRLRSARLPIRLRQHRRRPGLRCQPLPPPHYRLLR